jgi:hypothetical protein
MGTLTLTPIDGKDVGELTELSPEALVDIDKEGVQYEITVLEEKLAQMKPNMAAIAEYRKKVGKTGSCEIQQVNHSLVGQMVVTAKYCTKIGVTGSNET